MNSGRGLQNDVIAELVGEQTVNPAHNGVSAKHSELVVSADATVPEGVLG